MGQTIVFGCIAGIATYIVIYSIMEHELCRYKQYARWKAKRVIEDTSTTLSIVVGFGLMLYLG